MIFCDDGIYRKALSSLLMSVVVVVKNVGNGIKMNKGSIRENLKCGVGKNEILTTNSKRE